MTEKEEQNDIERKNSIYQKKEGKKKFPCSSVPDEKAQN